MAKPHLNWVVNWLHSLWQKLQILNRNYAKKYYKCIHLTTQHSIDHTWLDSWHRHCSSRQGRIFFYWYLASLACPWCSWLAYWSFKALGFLHPNLGWCLYPVPVHVHSLGNRPRVCCTERVMGLTLAVSQRDRATGSLIVSACSQETNGFGYVMWVGCWPFRTKNHAGISTGTRCHTILPKALGRQQFSGVCPIGW